MGAAVKNNPLRSIRSRLGRQRGFTLIELMIALLIALFLIGGLLTLVQAMKSTSISQSGMSQLQDNERMAMTLMTDVIQSTGYFPNPAGPGGQTAASSFPVSGAFTFAGQALVGAGSFTDAAPGNSISVRYLTSGTDNIINCTGGTSTVAATFVNTFSVDSNGNLNCTLIVNGVAQPPVPLINGVNSLNIVYGVQTNPSLSNSSVDTYLDATAVNNSPNGPFWNKVISVKITLSFINPLFGQSGQTGAAMQFIQFTRVVAVMNKTGVTT
jgi:type IV pilus assembly protein PilW